ncbi:MAG: hypothetical protein JNN05_10935, partial [Candidatus Omnitrophica bacterium]|nr:hypothetical protein [Candidatus Omnitrophota bacterium]
NIILMELFSVVKSGFFDSLNPCNLSTAIIFAGYLTFLRKYQCNVKVMGGTFIVLSWGGIWIALCGYFMPILYSDLFFQFGRMFYCLVGVIFMLVGGFVFRSWVQSLQKKSLSGWNLYDTGDRRKIFFLIPQFFLVYGAIFLNAMATIWPMDRQVTLLSYDLWDREKIGIMTFVLLGIYAMMLILPLALARFWIPLSSENGWIAKNTAKARSIVSAVLIGVGFGLVYVFR